MSDISERYKNLTPEQQQLLKLRLQKREQEAESAKKSESPAPRNPVMPGGQSAKTPGAKPTKVDFSLFFFSDDGVGEGSAKYKLLIESAKFADKLGFKAVWTPERHFQTFGGLYPNPSVLGAALAMITERIQLRAGSVVVPLHHPIRIAEEWSLVDNLSNGRAAMSIATGWHEHDYVIRPENYHDRRDLMFQYIDIVQKLWRGESVNFKGVDGKETAVVTLPRPVQKELPIWVTAASPRTFKRAGEVGAGVLTTFGSNLDELAGHIKNYRQGLVQNGHDPRSGTFSLMLHTYLDNDMATVKQKTRGPLTEYLNNYLNQFKQFMDKEYIESQLSDTSSILDFAYQRYVSTSSLLGTQEKCADMIESLAAVGVDDMACLIDFGVDFDSVMKSLNMLNELRQTYGR